MHVGIGELTRVQVQTAVQRIARIAIQIGEGTSCIREAQMCTSRNVGSFKGSSIATHLNGDVLSRHVNALNVHVLIEEVPLLVVLSRHGTLATLDGLAELQLHSSIVRIGGNRLRSGAELVSRGDALHHHVANDTLVATGYSIHLIGGVGGSIVDGDSRGGLVGNLHDGIAITALVERG